MLLAVILGVDIMGYFSFFLLSIFIGVVFFYSEYIIFEPEKKLLIFRI